MTRLVPRRLQLWRSAERRDGYARDVQISGEVAVSTPRDGVGVVALTGEHDLGTVTKVRDAIEGAQSEQGTVVVDLCNATFVDSSILGAILAGRRQAGERGLGFGVACDGSSEPVRKVLEVTGLDKELPVHQSVELAIDAVMPRAGST